MIDPRARPAALSPPRRDPFLASALSIALLFMFARLLYTYSLPMNHDLVLSTDCYRAFMAVLLLGLSFLAERRVRYPMLAHVMRGLGLVFIGSIAIAPCHNQIYWTGRNFPIADEMLARADRWFAFDWPTYVAAFKSHDKLLVALRWAYETITRQPFAIGLLLAYRGDTRQLYMFIIAQTVTIALVCFTTMFLPAYGTWHHFSAAAQTFDFIREGDFDRMVLPIRAYRAGFIDTVPDVPLVQFPSYHAAACLLCTWGVWGTRMRYPMLILNLAMFVASPIYGSHYFTDLLGGLAVALLGIVAASYLVRTRSLPTLVWAAWRAAAPRLRAVWLKTAPVTAGEGGNWIA